MRSVTAAQIDEAFAEIDEDMEDVEGSEDILKTAVALCQELKLSADILVAKWDTYKYAMRITEGKINLDAKQFANFARHVKADIEKKKRKASTPARGSLSHKKGKSKNRVFTPNNLAMLGSSDGFGFLNTVVKTESPQRGAITKSDHPTTPNYERSRNALMSPSLEPSPVTQKFDKRENQGEVVASFNKDQVAEITAPGEGEKVAENRVCVEVLNAWKGPFRYMYEDLEEKRDNLSDRVETMVEHIAETNRETHGVRETEEGATSKILEFSPTGVSMQEAVFVAGRVCPGQAGKMKATSIVIEGSKATSNGKVMKLRMGQLKEYACFPGQIMGLKGINNTGTGMVVEGLLAPAVLPHSSVPLADVTKFNKKISARPMSVMVAAGPFTLPDAISFGPLNDLLKRARVLQPDVLLLMGPFLPRSHPDITSGNVKETFDTMFEHIMAHIIEQLEGLAIKVLVSLSTKDVTSDPVVPKAPPDIKNKEIAKKITFLSNPATFKLNDITFGLMCEDTMFALGQSEVAKGGGNRFARLASHIITQQSYYPLFPPKEGDNIEFTHYDKLSLPVTPDILLLPSRFKYFASDIGHECVCVNPASLAKGAAGGTYAVITIHSLQEEEMKKAEKNEKVVAHHITSRTRVDIARI